MNPRLRVPLILIGVITIIVMAIFVVPRGLSLYYQTRGGQQIEYVLRFEEGIQELVCEGHPSSDEEALKEVEQGIVDLSRAVRFNQNNSQAYYYLGKAHCLSGNPEQAVENFKVYTELRPDNPLGYIGLGFAYEKLGEMPSAKEAWISAGLKPGDFNSVGDEEFQAEDYEGAITWYDRAFLIDPKSAESLLNLGKVYESQNDQEKALEFFQKAWELDPELSTSDLVDGYKRVGDMNSVENVLQHMIDNYPESQDRLLWFQELGSSYLSHGDYDQAVELYSLAINEFPNQPELHISLGWALYERGEGVDAARSEFDLAIDLDSDNGAGYYAVGQLMNREEDFIEAVKWLKDAVRVDPEKEWYAIVLGNALRSVGELASAEEVYYQIIHEHQNYDRAYLELAQVYFLLYRNDDAKWAIEKALEYSSSPTEWYFIRAGKIYEQAGEPGKALRYYYEALGIDPTNTTALQAIELLED